MQPPPPPPPQPQPRPVAAPQKGVTAHTPPTTTATPTEVSVNLPHMVCCCQLLIDASQVVV